MSALRLKANAAPTRTRSVLFCAALASFVLTLPCATLAQDAEGKDHSQMDHSRMDHENMQHDQRATPKAESMPEGQRSESMQQMDMGSMQGGKAPPDARDPDAYAEGLKHGPMRGMDMADDALFGRLLIDKLEYAHSKDGNSQVIDAQAWYTRTAPVRSPVTAWSRISSR